MGNAQSGTQKQGSPAKSLLVSGNGGNDLLTRERFLELAVEEEDGRSYVPREVFTKYADFLGPRGSNVLARLYGVLDVNGDGKLDLEEFKGASYLLGSSSDGEKLKLLFDMYSSSKSGFVERDELQEFLLDVIAACPPSRAPQGRGGPIGPPVDDGGGGGEEEGVTGQGEQHRQNVEGEKDPPLDIGVGTILGDLLDVMADAVMAQHDVDGDRKLSEKEWCLYLKSEEESTTLFLRELSARAGKLFAC